jgi:uncharacterized membrane protein
MTNVHPPWSDRQIESIIGQLLRAGVLLAAVVVLAGGILYLAQDGALTPHYHHFRREPSELSNIPGIVQGTLRLQSGAIIQFGLLLLILTPICRVAFSIVAFALERDFMYVIFTVIVLTVLLYALLGS